MAFTSNCGEKKIPNKPQVSTFLRMWPAFDMRSTSYFNSHIYTVFQFFNRIMIFTKVILLYNKQHSMNLSQNDSLDPPTMNSEEEVASLMVYILFPAFILGISNNQ